MKRAFKILLFLACSIVFLEAVEAKFPVPKIEFNPKSMICPFTEQKINVDGADSEAVWDKAPWSDTFVDIEGAAKPLPYLDTKVKMLWDNEYLYIFADMEELHLTAKLTQRDDIIFRDNDFEIFIDPDGDTHNYYELEINALNTVWDLLLLNPYRDNGQLAYDSWDIQGLKTAVKLNGTLNDPNDIDEGWSVEIAIPWKVLEEGTTKKCPPRSGDVWRMNFSRVQWDFDIQEGSYVKKDSPEHNWVWSPQGLIAMHYPEMWGFVHFTKRVNVSSVDLSISDADKNKWILRQFYYAQKEYWEINHKFAMKIDELIKLFPNLKPYKGLVLLQSTESLYEFIYKPDNVVYHLTQDGLIWETEN